MTGFVVAYGLLLWAVVGSFIRPLHGFVAYACLAIIQPQALWQWSLPADDRISLIAGIAMILGWALHMGGDLKLCKAWWGVAALVGFWACAVVSGGYAMFQDIANEYLGVTAKIVFPCVVGIMSIRSARDLHFIAWSMILAQTLLAYFLNERYFTTGINTPQEGYGSMGRAVFGVSLAMTVALCIGYVVYSQRRWVQGLGLICLALIGHTLLLTYSRGALLHLLITGMMTFYLMPKNKTTVGLAALAALVIAVGAGQSVIERFSTIFVGEEERDASAQSRLVLWQNCLTLIAENPVIGVGPEHFGKHATRFGWQDGKEAHNLWLQTGAEIGPLGMLLLLVFYLYPSYWLYYYYFGSGRRLLADYGPDPDLESIACMTLAAISGFLVSSQFVTIIRLEVPFYIAVLALGALKLTGQKLRQPPWTDDDDWDDELLDSPPDEELLAYAD